MIIIIKIIIIVRLIIPTTLRADVPVAIRATTKTWKALRFPSTIGVGNAAFRATKSLSTVGVDIPVDHSFQSYQNPNNFKS